MRRFLAVTFLAVAVSAIAQPCGPPLPIPKIAYLSKENVPGFTRYWFSVTNHAQFNNVFFTASPNLPPCGLNTSASRTWLRIYNGGTTNYIYGYCALSNNLQMKKLGFAVPSNQPQPESIYITLEDRVCKVTKKSNFTLIP
jgi:hypothetical protein